MFAKITTILFSIWLALISGFIGGHGFVHEVSSSKTTCHGIETPYSIRIHSEEIYGLVQLEFNLPQGLHAKVVGNQNSEVTYGSGSVSLLWEDLLEDEINIDLAFTSDLEFDHGEVLPTLSYIKNGERVDVALDKTMIHALTYESSLDQTPGISCLRHITDEGDGVTRIDLVIDGEGFDGFLKITEHIPGNCIVEVIDSELSLAQVGNGLLSFVWFDAKSPLPITVTYKLLGCSHLATLNINGNIDYAFGNTGFSKDIADYTLSLIEGSKLLNMDQIVDNTTLEGVIQTNANQAIVPDEGIAYRVQILAGHNDVSDNWVAKKYDFNGRSDTEIHEGWIKYTTGSFIDYESARNERESINSTHNFPEPFVTAYYLGERISVSEALVISHQDWLQ